MSTFLDPTKILIQIGHRFTLFDEKGHFKCQLDFDKRKLPKNQKLEANLPIKYKYMKSTNQHMEMLCMSSNN